MYLFLCFMPLIMRPIRKLWYMQHHEHFQREKRTDCILNEILTIYVV